MIVEDVKAATTAIDATDDGDEVIPKPTDYRLLLSYYYFRVPRIYCVLC